jgi:hypothetical protein
MLTNEAHLVYWKYNEYEECMKTLVPTFGAGVSLNLNPGLLRTDL